MKKSNGGFVLTDFKKTREYQEHQRMLEEFRQMSEKEKFQTMVDAGIYTQDGELTERYGGSAPNPPETE